MNLVSTMNNDRLRSNVTASEQLFHPNTYLEYKTIETFCLCIQNNQLKSNTPQEKSSSEHHNFF